MSISIHTYMYKVFADLAEICPMIQICDFSVAS